MAKAQKLKIENLLQPGKTYNVDPEAKKVPVRSEKPQVRLRQA